MPVVCPSVLAADEDSFKIQINTVAGFAHRIHIDLADGQFAPEPTVKPQTIWWPAGVKADIHLMYENPESIIENLLEHRPHMILVHAESKGNFESLAQRVKKAGVKIGVVLLEMTRPHTILASLQHIDHVLVFSGHLGHFGGHAKLELLYKVDYLKHHKPSLEIGWDGGISSSNISELAAGGVDVMNVGGFIQKAANPEKAYEILDRIAQETGTT